MSTERERVLRTPFWTAEGREGAYQPARSAGMLPFRTGQAENISASGIGLSTVPAGALVCCRDLETGGCNGPAHQRAWACSLVVPNRDPVCCLAGRDLARTRCPF